MQNSNLPDNVKLLPEAFVAICKPPPPRVFQLPLLSLFASTWLSQTFKFLSAWKAQRYLTVVEIGTWVTADGLEHLSHKFPGRPDCLVCAMPVQAVYLFFSWVV